MKKSLFLLFALIPAFLVSQSRLDTLETQLKESKDDRNRCDILNNIALYVVNKDPEKAREYFLQARSLAEKANYQDGLAFSLFNEANVLYYEDDYESGLKKLDEAEKIFQKTQNTKGLGNVLNCRGEILSARGDYSDALNYLFEALKHFEANKDLTGITKVNLNVGVIHYFQKNYEEALKYFIQALETADNLLSGDASMYIGKVYVEQNKYSEAKKYLELGLAIGTKNQDNYIISDCYYLLGKVDLFYGDKVQAKTKFEKALSMQRELENYQGITTTCNQLGILHLSNNEITEAKKNFKEAFTVASEKGIKEELKQASLGLSNTFNYLKSYDSAYHYLRLHNSVNDELLGEEAGKKLAELEASLAAQKREAQIEAERKLQSFTKKVLISSSVGLILVFIVISLIMYNRYKLKKKANEKLEAFNKEIVMQRDIIEQKNHEIMDSIRYAKRIQEAILPANETIASVLSDFFVLYKPKDIVSGDFYWAQKINDGGKQKLLIAAVDCTGHGVPGAFVSIVGNSGLGRAVKEFHLARPAEILDKLNLLVEDTFKQKSTSDIKDGMDINLCLIDLHEKGATLEFAAANNPLWILRNNGGYVIEEIKADKQPIGAFIDRKPFTNHLIQLNKGDCVYIFSDGYADQFGGEKQKKFKYKQLEQFLLANAHLPMERQKTILDDAFEKWKGNLEQVDDVCVIGVKI
jgi:serine phosphatase RsbU (regulator of sigma subunit)/Tfp pilus assembly protein PilF